MWFKKGEASDCLLGEVPINESTEVIKHPASLLGPEKITVKTGSKARRQPTGPLHAQPRPGRAAVVLSISRASVAVACQELDLMPIKLGEMALWTEAVEEQVRALNAQENHGGRSRDPCTLARGPTSSSRQIELARTIENAKPAIMPLGGLCQCVYDDLARVLSGMMYMASKSLGCVPKPAGKADAVA